MKVRAGRYAAAVDEDERELQRQAAMGDRDAREVMAPTFDYQPPQDPRAPWHQGEFRMVGATPWRPSDLPVRVVVRDRAGRVVGSALLPGPNDVDRDPQYGSRLGVALLQIADDVEADGEVVHPGVVLHVPQREDA